MPIVYHGNVAAVRNDLKQNRPTLENAYRSILGDELYQKVHSVAERTLATESFFEDVGVINRTLGQSLDADVSNKMFLASNATHEVDSNGRINDRKVQTAPAFYISEDGFAHSGSRKFTDRPLASYVHEWDHFVLYALQKVPIYLANSYGKAAQDPKPRSAETSISDYCLDLIQSGLDPRIVTNNVAIAIHNYSVTEAYEKGTRILDKLVLQEIGIGVELEWRHQDREQMSISLPTGLAMMSVGGDPYRGLSDLDAVNRIIHWNDHLSRPQGSSYLNSFFDSLSSLKVSRVSLPQLMSTLERRNKKTQKRRK